ncbi:hypothetical protein ACEZDO_20765, partial [Yersinia pestis]
LTLWSTVSTPGSLADWQRAESRAVQAERLKQAVLFSSQHDWLNAQVLPVLQAPNADVAPPCPATDYSTAGCQSGRSGACLAVAALAGGAYHADTGGGLASTAARRP